MGIAKQNTTPGKPIKVWGFGLWMTTQESGPIIQIVKRDEENIRARGGCRQERLSPTKQKDCEE